MHYGILGVYFFSVQDVIIEAIFLHSSLKGGGAEKHAFFYETPGNQLSGTV